MKIWCDGSWDGGATFGWAVVDENGLVRSGKQEKAPPSCRATGNYAEYRALLEAIKHAARAGVATIHVDSNLVFNQVNGTWRVESRNLVEICEECRKRLSRLPRVQVTWIPREENKADVYSR